MRAAIVSALVVVVVVACKDNESPSMGSEAERPSGELPDVISGIAEAEQAKKRAEAAAAQAVKDAQDAKDTLDRLMKEMAALDLEVDAAVNALTDARNDAERAAAKARLTALQKQQLEIKQRAVEAQAAATRAERLKGVKISKECLENPLAKGCS